MFQQVCVWLSALASMALASSDTYYSGNSLLYTHEEFSSGNCNFMYDPGVGNYYAALNSDQWDSTLNCGRCAEVSSDETSAVTVYIVDKCTECEDEGLGLSPLVFKQLTRSDPSLSIKWKFVDCPVSGNIEYCANSLSKSSWLAVQPANSVTGVASMKIANQDATLVESSFYFVLNGSKVNMSAVNIELTSISGETLTETLSLVAGNCTEGTSNLAASFSHQQESEVNEYFDTLKSGDGGYTAGKVTPPNDSEQIVTRSEATSSGSSLLFVVPVLLLVVGGIALVYIIKRKKRLFGQRIDREKEKSSFGTLNSPVLVKETIAKI
ncbi:hypothetical protein JG688_00014255 [Phytophthora aleatoria]|uniref:Expansin-like EG45 domain-containing protein n=1 Tax=Phytophthora aleatoria TaxID=2496075 RepID=A0A8J5I859_9STRA|nr:hypothetical protein JG688_00014255 [Phytophthora aleatoria]